MATRDSQGKGPLDRVWSPKLREAFLASLRDTGNAQASARRLGHVHLFKNRMRRDPDFRRDCEAAMDYAQSRLDDWPAAFPGAVELKSMPPGGDEPPGPLDGNDADEPVIRRTSNGRIQISYVRAGDMSSADEDRFNALLRATGQFTASAIAIGFSPSTLYRRVHRWPEFARRCAEARDEADVELDYKLVSRAHALMRGPGEARLDGEEEVPFDPEAAMRILNFLDRRKAGRVGSRRRRGPPERAFEEAVESILAKIEAIERHRELMRRRKEGEE